MEREVFDWKGIVMSLASTLGLKITHSVEDSLVTEVSLALAAWISKMMKSVLSSGSIHSVEKLQGPPVGICMP